MRWLTFDIGPAGPIIPVTFGVTEPMRLALTRAGKASPAPVSVPMLVDTGASHTFVEQTILSERLGLSMRNRYRFHSATTAPGSPDECAAFDASVTLGSLADNTLWRVGAIEIMGSREGRSYGLLGRDVLERLHMEWRGPAGVVRLGFP